ncbi:hypothetical protein H6F89_04190 [Cyanobacteria bacterium FACHB-63]|nr:hypothetical protein [Cyanobacteria bacterium FACHB-63]
MPILCFEGPSAVGKTTTAQSLKAAHGAFVIPEVNQLFGKPEVASAEWYFERQVDRWLIAIAHNSSHNLVILDGDPFQPLWYNWAYDFVNGQRLGFLNQFYRPRVETKTIGFPDRYIVFSAREDELRNRKLRDTTRQRGGFEQHLKMIQPQRRYFQAMQTLMPDRVLFLEAERIQKNVEFVQQNISNPVRRNPNHSVELFDQLVQWLRENRA